MADGKPYSLKVSSEDDREAALAEIREWARKHHLEGTATGELNELIRKIRLEETAHGELHKAAEIIKSAGRTPSAADQIFLDGDGRGADDRREIVLPPIADLPTVRGLLLRLHEWEERKGTFFSAKIKSLAMNMGWTAEKMRLAVASAEGLNWLHVSRHDGETPEYGGSHVALTELGREKAQEWADDEELRTTGALMGIREDCDELMEHLYFGLEALDDDSRNGSWTDTASAASDLQWPPLRINRAIEVLAEQGLVEEDESLGSHPYRTASIGLTTKGVLVMEERKAAQRGSAQPRAAVKKIETAQEVRRRSADPKRVFVITGRNEAATAEMTTFLKYCGLDALPFNEVRNKMPGNATIAEIVQRGMEQALTIIALITPDEWSVLRPDKRITVDNKRTYWKERWQARPNVIFEAGMAWGIDAEFLAIVVLGDAELWTDVDGVHVFRLNDNPTGPRGDLYDWLKHRAPSAVRDTREWQTAGRFEPTVQPVLHPHDPFTAPSTATIDDADDEITSDADAEISIRQWLGTLPKTPPVDMAYSALDRARKLPTGACKRLLRKVVEAHGDWRLKEGDARFLIEYGPRAIVVNRSDRG